MRSARSGLEGDWLVQRVSGLLPPRGLRKTIRKGSGSTRLGRFPVAPFRVCGTTLVYRLIPVKDELAPLGDGAWVGRGLLLGRQFCRFRLVRRQNTRRGPSFASQTFRNASKGDGRSAFPEVPVGEGRYPSKRAKGVDMSSTQMPEGQGGKAAADPEPKKEQRDWDEQERTDESEGSHDERRSPGEDEQGTGQGSARGAV